MGKTINREGGCACGGVRYILQDTPLFTHCCHCTWCQRESGSAFALNAMVETDRLELIKGRVALVHTPSASGRGQVIARCPHCQVALYSHYPGLGEQIAFVRVGTLDTGHGISPDVHIFTSTKQPWVVLDEGVPIREEFYDRRELWPKESLARLRALRGQ